MGSSKVTSLLLIYILFISTASPILGCPYCGVPSPTPRVKPPSTPQPPVTVPVPGVPVPIPPVTVPPVVPVPIPPVTVPPITPVLPLPPVLPVPLPPVPIVNPPTTPGPSGKPCPVPEPKCPINVLKLSACVDVLGGLVHGVIGHPLKSKCCSVVKGLVDLDAALCLCTILKIKALNLKIYAPIALEVLLTCGKHPPPGFTCPF